MFKFNIVKKSKISKARLGIIETEHGVIETPCLVPVATQAVIKTLNSEEVLETKSQILICNTFHLLLKPGEEIIKEAGGLHRFMNWKRPLMTDSGGYQIFSFGFGKDYGIGKILKNSQPAQISLHKIKMGEQPKFLKITERGVFFRSPLDGKKLFLGPKESIKIQEKLGADIIFALDECTSPVADYKYTKNSLIKTHKWAKICMEVKKSKQAIFGIVQGGKYKDLRIESAKFFSSLLFDGFGIGGEFGDNKKIMTQMLKWVIKELPEEKPRHLLGIGYLEDIPKIIKAGVDTFDCIVPTHYARRGIAFTSEGTLNLRQAKFLKAPEGKPSASYGASKNPLDKKCSCFVCQNYKRNYICHLLRANEITALKLLTFHNLYFFNSFVENLRKEIKKEKI